MKQDPGHGLHTQQRPPIATSLALAQAPSRKEQEFLHSDIVVDVECCHGSFVSALTMGTKRRMQSSPSGRRFTNVYDDKVTMPATTNRISNSNDNIIDNINNYAIETNVEKPRPQSRRLYGRKKELDTLLNLYGRIAAPKELSQVILLHGQRGCGKTTLAESLRYPIAQGGGYFVTGKFDSDSNKFPYSALVEALSDLCDLLAQQKGFGQPQQTKMHQKIGIAETKRLGLLLGNLDRVTGNNRDCMSNNSQSIAKPDYDTDHEILAHHFLLHSLQKFLRTTASSKHPICLFLDDLQFADQQSLELLYGLTTDPMSRNILFVFAYQNNVDETHLQRHLLKGLHRMNAMDMELSNWDMETLCQVLVDTIKGQTDDTVPLARVVFRKTHGQPMDVMQYIDSLRRLGLVSKSATTEDAWTWDVTQIQSETDVADSVASIVVNKITSCPQHVLFILKIASAIGNEFDRKLLEKVLITQCLEASARKSNANIQDLDTKVNLFLNQALKEGLVEKSGYSGQYLNIALKEGFLEKTGVSGKLKFSHERVRQHFYSFIPVGQSRQELHYSIGSCLRRMLQKYEHTEAPDRIVFAAAEQMNQVSRSRIDVEQFLQLNLRAARLAQMQGLFLPAADFLRSAQRMVDPKAVFAMHHDLGRELYTEIADVEFTLGDFPKAEAAARLVCRYAKSPEEKNDVCQILVDSLDAQGRGHDTVQFTLTVLEELGESFPSNPKAVKVIMELMKTQQRLQAMTDEELLNLPQMRDERELQILKVVSIFGTMTPHTGFELISLLSTLRIIQRSLNHGLTYISAFAFACFGKVMAMTGHPDEAFRFGNIALALLERFDTPSSIQANTMILVHSGCRHWKKPLKDSIQPFKEVYERRIAEGDIKFSFVAAQNYLIGSLESGVILPQVEVDMRTFCEGLDDMSLNANSCYFRTMIVPTWQMVLNLMGASEDPLRLKGAAMDEDQFLLDINNEKFVGGLLSFTKAKLVLAYHFDEYSSAEPLIEVLEKDDRNVCFHFTVYQVKMICCLTFLHLFEQTGQHPYHVKALQIIETLETWMGLGNDNCHPILLLLRAENAALNASQDQRALLCKSDFDSAILEAKRMGLTHVEALAAERAAVACFRIGNIRNGVSYVSCARNVYTKWGAHAKADHLERKFMIVSECISPKRDANHVEPISIDSINVRLTPKSA